MQTHFAPDDRSFDEQGRMIPYGELEALTRARFDEPITGRPGGLFTARTPLALEVRDEVGRQTAAWVPDGDLLWMQARHTPSF